MRILLVNYEYPPLGGGGGVIMAQLAEGLADRGHSVQVLTSRFRYSSTYEVQRGVTIHRAPVLFRTRLDVASQISMYSFLPSGIWTGLRKIDPDSVDLINTHFAIPSGPTGVYLARKWNKPHVLTTHGGDLYDPSKKLSPHRILPLKYLVKRVLNRSDRVVTDFQDLARRTKDIYEYQKPVEVIPYGLPEMNIPEPNRQEFGWGDDEIIFISVARLIPRKGFKYLLQALANLKDKKWKWVAVGSGPLQEPLMQQARELGIEDRVHTLGFVDEETKLKALVSADAFVLPSLHEGFGVVNLEAMACGLPIIATNVGGQTDFLEHEKNALLIPPSDVEALQAALRRILEDESLRKRFSQQNIEDVSAYNISSWVDRYEKCFEEVLAK